MIRLGQKSSINEYCSFVGHFKSNKPGDIVQQVYANPASVFIVVTCYHEMARILRTAFGPTPTSDRFKGAIDRGDTYNVNQANGNAEDVKGGHSGDWFVSGGNPSSRVHNFANTYKITLPEASRHRKFSHYRDKETERLFRLHYPEPVARIPASIAVPRRSTSSVAQHLPVLLAPPKSSVQPLRFPLISQRRLRRFQGLHLLDKVDRKLELFAFIVYCSQGNIALATASCWTAKRLWARK